MTNVIAAISRGFACFCVATIVAQLIIVAALWFRGTLTAQRRAQIMALFLDVDLNELGKNALGGSSQENMDSRMSTVSINERVAAGSDLKFRREAIASGLGHVSGFHTGLKAKRQRLEQLRTECGILLSRREKQVRAKAMLEVQATLESLAPKEAKTQMIRMMDDGGTDDVVTIVKAMPLDKRRKILGEFKSQDEAQKLHEILLQIRETDESSAQTEEGPTI